MEETSSSKLNFTFWLHLTLLILAWAGPFLIDWRLLSVAYVIVQLQFIFFKKCLMNGGHELKDDDDATFYSFLFEQMGLHVPRKPLKLIVRNGIYILLAIIAFTWQYILGNSVPFILPF